MKFSPALAALVTLQSSLVLAFPLVARQAGGVNICAALQGTANGCVKSGAVDQPLFFTCANGVQTLFTCDGGCKQQNAANLPTCDNGQLFNGSVV